MRAILLSLSLLLVPLAFVPTVEASHGYCDENVCCRGIDTLGEPGSPAYLVTSTADNAWYTTCWAIGTVPDELVELVECVVFGRC